jgi:hypothetical protein
MRPMNMKFRPMRSLVASIVVLASVSPALAGKIEATPGKRYDLTKQHGPWMIMAATFHSYDSDAEEGKPPEQAANDLVLELRQRNLPAYIYKLEGDNRPTETVDDYGRPERKKNLRRLTTWGVIAGNYDSLEDELAQKTLAYVKKLKPKCLDQTSGVVWFAQAGDGPLHNAFLTPNPLLSSEELASRQSVDPLLVKLNTVENHSLLENKGEYTLQIAMFTGRRMMQGSAASQLSGFRNDAERENPLDLAAQDAHDLATALRKYRNIEAYVWHDHYQSIVTVGSFSSLNDPKLKQTFDLFKAKPKGKISKLTGLPEPEPEVFTVNENRNGSTKMWPLMPQPTTIPVPRMKPRSVAMKLPLKSESR